VAEVSGPAAGLSELDALGRRFARLARSYPWWISRGRLLERLGRGTEAAECYHQASRLTSNRAVRLEEIET